MNFGYRDDTRTYSEVKFDSNIDVTAQALDVGLTGAVKPVVKAEPTSMSEILDTKNHCMHLNLDPKPMVRRTTVVTLKATPTEAIDALSRSLDMNGLSEIARLRSKTPESRALHIRELVQNRDDKDIDYVRVLNGSKRLRHFLSMLLGGQIGVRGTFEKGKNRIYYAGATPDDSNVMEFNGHKFYRGIPAVTVFKKEPIDVAGQLINHGLITASQNVSLYDQMLIDSGYNTSVNKLTAKADSIDEAVQNLNAQEVANKILASEDPKAALRVFASQMYEAELSRVLDILEKK